MDNLLVAIPSVNIQDCGICLTSLETGPTCSLVICHHKFHSDCIQNWFLLTATNKNHTCPLCRQIGHQCQHQEGSLDHTSKELLSTVARQALRTCSELEVKIADLETEIHLLRQYIPREMSRRTRRRPNLRLVHLATAGNVNSTDSLQDFIRDGFDSGVMYSISGFSDSD
jgi:hypothetical protein